MFVVFSCWISSLRYYFGGHHLFYVNWGSLFELNTPFWVACTWSIFEVFSWWISSLQYYFGGHCLFYVNWDSLFELNTPFLGHMHMETHLVEEGREKTLYWARGVRCILCSREFTKNTYQLNSHLMPVWQQVCSTTSISVGYIMPLEGYFPEQHPCDTFCQHVTMCIGAFSWQSRANFVSTFWCHQ